MEQVLEKQLKRTSILLQAFEICKTASHPDVQDLCNNISELFLKAEFLLGKRQELIKEKKHIVEGIEDLIRECNDCSSELTDINYTLFPEQSYSNNSHEKTGQYLDNTGRPCLGLNNFEVSPVPSAWENGGLDTPLQTYQTKNRMALEEVIPSIRHIMSFEMEQVPVYMKGGRLTCENINNFIDTLNSVIEKKYSIVNLKRKDVKRKDLIQYNNWKREETEYAMAGQVFFTVEDLSALLSFKLDKLSEKMIQILRHTQRLRQTHMKKVTLYILPKRK